MHPSLVALSCAGLSLAAWGIGWRHPQLGFLGLGLALGSGIGLWLGHFRAQKELQARQTLLLELNQSLDEQVQARTLRLMQTIEDLESFNRMITHDLRSPLTGLMTGLEVLTLKMTEERPEQLISRLDALRGCADRMRDLIEGLQELALISGRLPFLQAVDISHYSDLVLRHLQQKEPSRSVRWEIEPGLSVLGDPNLIRIGLENLLGNAWKYTVGRAPAEISVRRGPGPGRIIEIQDNGMGFDMTRASGLFQPFQRLHTNPQIPGHGIGLSIVKRVMTKHGGRVSAESSPGRGATFRLEFSEV